jgi:exodeoxyribonuclease VII large subunit
MPETQYQDCTKSPEFDALAECSVPLARLLNLSRQSTRPLPAQWVRVEVRTVRATDTHIFMTVCEPASARAQTGTACRCVLFESHRDAAMTPMDRMGFRLEPGVRLLALVQVRTFNNAPQLDVLSLFPRHEAVWGAPRRREIASRLSVEGIMNSNRSIPIPNRPQRVLAVVPPESAAYRDIAAESQRLLTHFGCNLEFCLVPFSQPDSPQQIIDAITAALIESPEEPEVIILARGGGPAEDISILDDYGLARFIAELHIPVFTGIGHAGDTTSIDEVASRSLDTPSKAILEIERLHLDGQLMSAMA